MPLWLAENPRALLRDYSSVSAVVPNAAAAMPRPVTHVVDAGDDGTANHLGRYFLFTDLTPEAVTYVARDAAAGAALCALGLPRVAADADAAAAMLPDGASSLLFLGDMAGGELVWLQGPARGLLDGVHYVYLSTSITTEGAGAGAKAKARYPGTPRTEEVTAWMEAAGWRRVALYTVRERGVADALFVKPPPSA
jgi:hypothetical protein